MDKIESILSAFKDSGLNFALKMDEFCTLLKVDTVTAGTLFNVVFDTDRNGLYF